LRPPTWRLPLTPHRHPLALKPPTPVVM
jgi:hypothetical protein